MGSFVISFQHSLCFVSKSDGFETHCSYLVDGATFPE